LFTTIHPLILEIKMNPFKQTWETYSQSWKLKNTKDKLAAFAQSLDKNCHYKDPLIKTTGYDELLNYMLDFHQQIPEGHFVTTYFMAHSNKSIACWNMCDAEGTKIGEGISYGQYTNDGKLIAMTEFLNHYRNTSHYSYRVDSPW